MSTAIEVYATDGDGTYVGADLKDLRAIEPTIPPGVRVQGRKNGYSLTVRSKTTGTAYKVTRLPNGTLVNSCSPAGKGECPPSGKW